MTGSFYSHEELYSKGKQRSFDGSATEAAFLLGGIGTGNVSIGARGEFRDWEIFNRPGKGNRLPYTFFAVRVRESGCAPVARVVESRIQPPFSSGQGLSSSSTAGLPRFEKSTMKGEYPFVRIDFHDDEIPVKISLEAFTPLIPLNPEDSGIPCGILKYRVRNPAKSPVSIAIAGSIANMIGFDGMNDKGVLKEDYFTGNINEFRQDEAASGLYMFSDNFKETYIRYGSMCLMTPEKNVTVKPYWLDGGWWDGVQDFWDDFTGDGLLENSSYGALETSVTHRDRIRIGSIGVPFVLDPAAEKTFTFILAWYFPNRVKDWNEDCNCSCGCKENIPAVRNHYSRYYKNAWDVGKYVLNNFKRLEDDTVKFHKALFSSTLPDYALDAAASNITVLRSTTCFWLEDGTFLGWEGCSDKNGCCFGNCTHVWNYAQTLAFLFPSLERSMRNTEFSLETDEKGRMAFRTNSVFGRPRWDFHPAADGQMGTIIRLYREWKISGDSEFLKKMWTGAKRAMDFAFTYWDSDGDCVLDSQQHNTYDIEFYGPNSLVNSMFLGALKAAAEMAEAVGDMESASVYRDSLEKGGRRMDELLWGGEYYIQKIDDIDTYRYQYGTGCLSDQLLGQFLCHVAGLGHILPREHVKQAVKSVYKYNFSGSLSRHNNVQRTYALNDEKGLLLCTWPEGGRPRLPFVYSDEVWTGIEYQVAAHLIYEGFTDEGLTLVKAVRERHDGYRRNPWNEVECGHHYARSMSSWAVLLALSGFKCDMVNRRIWFAPRINSSDFKTFWSTGTAWGTFSQKQDESTGRLEYKLDVLYGDLGDIELVTDEGKEP